LLTTESMWPSLAPLLEELDREIAMQRAPATHGY
jgi:hypothetical protein